MAAAAYSALQSRYLAEAETAFQFAGQPITLDVDRTGYLESAMGRYKEQIDMLADVKRSIIMQSSGSGVLSLSGGPTASFGGNRVIDNMSAGTISTNRLLEYQNIVNNF